MEEIYGYFSVIVRMSYVDGEKRMKTERRKYLVQSGTIEAAYLCHGIEEGGTR